MLILVDSLSIKGILVTDTKLGNISITITVIGVVSHFILNFLTYRVGEKV